MRFILECLLLPIIYRVKDIQYIDIICKKNRLNFYKIFTLQASDFTNREATIALLAFLLMEPSYCEDIFLQAH